MVSMPPFFSRTKDDHARGGAVSRCAALRILYWALGILALLNGLVFIEIAKGEMLTVSFFRDVSGAALVQTRQGHMILLTPAPSELLLQKLGEVMPYWRHTIDEVVSARGFPKSARALRLLSEKYIIGHTTIVGNPGEKEITRIRWTTPKGETDADRGEFIDALYEAEGEGAVALRIHSNGRTLLLVPRVTSRQERIVLQSDRDLRANILAIGEHAANTDMFGAFIEHVQPKLLILYGRYKGAGQNTADNIIETAARYGIKVMSTEKSGDIVIAL